MSRFTTVQDRPLFQYSILAILFLITTAYEIRHTKFVVDYLQQRKEAVEVPGTLNLGSPALQSVTKQGREAGLHVGDAILAFNGQPLRGLAQLISFLQNARPGDSLTLTVRPKTGDSSERTVRILLQGKKSLPSDQWAFVFSLHVLLPLACALLGFWVAFVRPRDPLAWLLLAFLLSFGQLFTLGSENMDGSRAGNVALTYHLVWGAGWFIWLFLLGIYFPTRLEFDRRFPWLKWLMVVPLTVSGMIEVVLIRGLNEDNNFAAGFIQYYQRINKGFAFLPVLAILLFFVSIIAKYFFESQIDARRRLRLFYVGTFLAIVPVVVLVIVGALTGRGLDEFPAGIELPSLLATMLFPLGLAYLIVIHKAMDVRVVIRQGVQYALARGGVRVLQGLMAASLIVGISIVVTTHRVRLPQAMGLIGWGFVFLLFSRRGMRAASAWIDRRFFRETYNAEVLLGVLAEKVRTMVETRPLLETVASRIAESLHVPRVAVLLGVGRGYQPAYAIGYDPSLNMVFPEGGTVEHLRKNNEPARVYLTDPNSWIHSTPDVSPEEREKLALLRSELLLPLAVKERLLGFISLSQKKSEAAYSGADLRLLNSVASQTALALENARLMAAIADEVAQRERLNRELEIAREVQERLLPQELPPVAGLDYAGACRPALGVGGDYYDFIALPTGKLGIAIGDVSGKGISAALMMANLQAALRGQTMSSPDDVSGIITRMNRLIYQSSTTNRYATFFFGEYDPATRQLCYVNAGHNPPMLFRRSDGSMRLDRLEVGGPVVGLLGQFSYEQATVVLNGGDVLVAFTDGISESMNPAEEEWGEDALITSAQECLNQPASEILEHLMQRAVAFAAGANQHDDMTLVILRGSDGGTET